MNERTCIVFVIVWLKKIIYRTEKWIKNMFLINKRSWFGFKMLKHYCFSQDRKCLTNNAASNTAFFFQRSIMFIVFGLLYLLLIAHSSRAEVSDTDLNNLSEQQNSVKINKCCENNELMVDSGCRLAEQYNQSKYLPCKVHQINPFYRMLHKHYVCSHWNSSRYCISTSFFGNHICILNYK